MDSINTLWPKNLVEIFQYLSPKMIKTCCLVCKRWNDVIENSDVLMNKFKLNLDKTKTALEDARKIRRKYQTVFMKNLNIDSLDVLSRRHLCQLTITSDLKIEKWMLADLLNDLPQLKFLNLISLKTTERYLPKNKLVRVNLEEVHCKSDILHIFGISSLVAFKLDWECENTISRKTELTKFFANQPGLTKLTITGKNCRDFFFLNVTEFKFRLKSFIFDYSKILNIYEEINNFLTLHQRTLEHLVLNHWCQSIDLTNKIAIHRLKNLKHFETTTIDHDTIKYEGRKFTTKIESLKFHLTDDLTNNKKIFFMFRNLTHFDFEVAYEAQSSLMSNLYAMSKIIIGLESLKISEISIYNITFPKLRKISLLAITHAYVFTDFIRRHHDILEEIEIRFNVNINATTVDEMLKCKNLKSLRIIYDDVSLLPLFNGISLRKKPFVFSMGLVTFRFPDDQAIWDKRCKIWSDDLAERLNPESAKYRKKKFEIEHN